MSALRTLHISLSLTIAVILPAGCGGDGKAETSAIDSTGSTDTAGPEDTTSPTDTGVSVEEVTCVNIRPLESRIAEPTKNAVAVAFSVTSCEGAPIAGLKTDDFEFLEDGSPIVASEAGATILDRTASVYITLVLDNSPSVADAGGVDAVADAAQAFIQQVMNDEGGVRVSVLFFSKTLDQQLDYSSDKDAVIAAIDTYRTNSTGSNTTNLYGSLIEAIHLSNEAQSTYAAKMQDGVLLLGHVVMFTDGADLAAVASLDEAKAAVSSTSDGVTLVAFGPEADPSVLDQISTGASLVTESPQDLADLFTAAGDRMVAERKAIYVMGYCSPKLAGQHEVTLKLGDKGTSIPIPFSAAGWLTDAGPECSTDKFDNACVDIECGGLWCGGCAGACNAALQCYCEDTTFKGKNCDECTDETFTGANCDQCSDPKYTGAGCDECADPKYTGVNCDECADAKYTGASCDECADPTYTGANCDECADPTFTGANCDECASDHFTGVNCDQCTDAKFGLPDCTSTCAENYYPTGDCSVLCSPESTCNGAGTCDNDGTCICDAGIAGVNCNGCDDPKFTGAPACDQCANQWTGADCNTCPDNWGGDKCDQCASNWQGGNCQECANAWAGDGCDVCPDNWTGAQCDACTDAFTGANCDQCADPKMAGAACTECADAAFAEPDCQTCFHPNKTGADCLQCKDGYYPAGSCTNYCNASTSCSGRGTCTNNGLCQCDPGYGGIGCAGCGPGFSGVDCEWMTMGYKDDLGNFVAVQGPDMPWYMYNMKKEIATDPGSSWGVYDKTVIDGLLMTAVGTQPSGNDDTCADACNAMDYFPVSSVITTIKPLSDFSAVDLDYWVGHLKVASNEFFSSYSPFIQHPHFSTWQGLCVKHQFGNTRCWAKDDPNYSNINASWSNSSEAYPLPCLCVQGPVGGGSGYGSCGNGVCDNLATKSEDTWCPLDCNQEVVSPLP